MNVHANSEARFERVLATIRALDPSVTVLRETREPAPATCEPACEYWARQTVPVPRL